MRISDWSSDVCSSDLGLEADLVAIAAITALRDALQARFDAHANRYPPPGDRQNLFALAAGEAAGPLQAGLVTAAAFVLDQGNGRSEEHTSELKSLMRISYAVFCLKKKTITKNQSSRT